MSDLAIEVSVSEAERMFDSVQRIDDTHENFAFLVEEVHRELSKAGDAIRNKMMNITSEQKEHYSNRVEAIRSQLGPFLNKAKRARTVTENERKEREWRRNRWK